MNLQECGILIAQLRKEAGYTQLTLAEKLGVTDKAVSKWERGICLPNAELLPLLSMLLDVDIENILFNKKLYGQNEKWYGEIRVSELEYDLCGKPLVHYLLSLFMLAGIKDIAIISNEWNYLDGLNLSQYGLNISYCSFHKAKTMIVYDKFIIFGANLTRYLNLCLSDDSATCFQLQGVDIPLLFSHVGSVKDLYKFRHGCNIRKLGRGMVYIPLNTAAERSDAEKFIQIYEKYNNCHYTDLREIASLRKLIV